MNRELVRRTQRRVRRAVARLTADGRLRALQPWSLLVGPLLLLLALAAPFRWLFFLAYALLLAALGAYAWVRTLGPRVALRRTLRSEWAQVGDTLEEQWEVVNRAPLPLLWLEVDDASTLPGYTGRRVAAVGARERQTWTTESICARRGVYTLGPLRARLADPLGLFGYEWQESSTREIVIYPPLARLAAAAPWGRRGGQARADVLQQHATPSVGGLREYVPGDMPSHIHWPTVARTSRLMVKEFDQERAGALWIALDLWFGAYEGAAGACPARDAAPSAGQALQGSAIDAGPATTVWDSPLELAIVAAGSLAAEALAEGRSVGLLADDGRRRLLTPARGPRQLWRILGELVDAQATGHLPLGDVIREGRSTRALSSEGAALAVVTPELGGEWLPALVEWQRGRPGATLALLIARSRGSTAAIEGRLAALATRTLVFEVGRPLPLLTPPRPRPVARVSPLGRVVPGGR